MRRLVGILVVIGMGMMTWSSQAVPAFSQGENNQVWLPLIRTTGAAPPPPAGDAQLTAATYLGGAGDDQVNAVDVALDGTIVLGGVMPNYSPDGVTPIVLPGGGDGTVLRLDQTGQTIRSVTSIGQDLADLEIDDAGNILACGDFGVALLAPDASATQWNATPGTGTRCAVGRDGTAAALVDGNAHVYASDGTPLANWAIGGSAQSDIAVDSANRLVIATGFTQVGGNLQLPFIRAWSYDGQLQWKSYDFANAPGLGADSRGERIAMGRDGKLYFAGSINGGTGVSVFSRDPKDLDAKLGQDRLVVTDKYTNPFNIGSVKMTWFGRFDPTDGSLELGQSLLTRRTSNDKGNSIVVKGIAADAAGQVYLAGSASCCIKERDSQQLAGTTVGNYEGGESFFFAVSPDFRERRIWTPFSAPGVSAGGSPANGVGVRDGVVAVGITLKPKDGSQRGLMTYQALQDDPTTLPEAYVALWSFR